MLAVVALVATRPWSDPQPSLVSATSPGSYVVLGDPGGEIVLDTWHESSTDAHTALGDLIVLTDVDDPQVVLAVSLTDEAEASSLQVLPADLERAYTLGDHRAVWSPPEFTGVGTGLVSVELGGGRTLRVAGRGVDRAELETVAGAVVSGLDRQPTLSAATILAAAPPGLGVTFEGPDTGVASVDPQWSLDYVDAEGRPVASVAFTPVPFDPASALLLFPDARTGTALEGEPGADTLFVTDASGHQWWLFELGGNTVAIDPAGDVEADRLAELRDQLRVVDADTFLRVIASGTQGTDSTNSAP